MKTRWVSFFSAAVLLTMFLLTGYQPVLAAPPTGEAKSAAPFWGNHTPIPYLEITQAQDWMALLYDYLVACNAEGSLSSDVSLARKWEMSRDGLTWTFYLRKGVKFHDGVELTAKDVKFSMEKIVLPDSVSTNAAAIRRDVKNIEVKDPYTLVIQCKSPSIFLPNLLSNMEGLDGMVIPKDYYEKVGKDEFSKHPVGSGPYKFHSQMAGSFVKLEATEKHWRDGVPRYKYMTYLVIPEESTRTAMLKTGEADISRISREAVKEASDAGLNIITKDNAASIYFVANMQWTSPVFSDIRFRKALNFAIDRDAVVKHLFSGLAKPIATYPGSCISAMGGDPGLKPYPYNPQEAKRLIKEGGWEGVEFTLISFPRAGCPEFPRLVEAVAGYWQQIGLKPKIRMTEWSVWRKTINDRKSQNAIHGTDSSLSPEISTLVPKFMDRWYFENPRACVNIPELNKKFERIEKTLDVAEVVKLMAEINRYAYDHHLLMPICEFPDKIATTKRIPKWDPGQRRNDRNYHDLIMQR